MAAGSAGPGLAGRAAAGPRLRRRECRRGHLARGRARVLRSRRGRALLPLDACLGPKLVGPLPRGKCCRVREVRAVRRRGAGRSGTGGLESRAARPAIPRLGRAQRLGRRLRRQRRGPGSVWLPAGRRYRGARQVTGRAGSSRRRLRCLLGCLQEPSRRGCHAGPGIVVRGGLTAGLLVRGRHRGGLRGGPGFLGIIGLRLAWARNHQARWHGPGGQEIFRIIPAEQACTLPFFLRRGTRMTIPTRLVTLCIHHRPQSRHIYGKCRSVPILTLSRPYGLARGSMLPTETERVQRAIFGLRRTNAAGLARGWRSPGSG